ncbi:antibiotic biosynthesis monooxygenase [Dyadobacter subterraneus]|uniref:ABM domain-containing protein n=1 Tax=Dyadobacter subterraneus TaxID=2773304 RepID=A0ABR9WAE1_9BACT|nr:antibiotic biosynthesis monooxygenase [Dyadobacter subterraneus]MBE9461926.1 hypothetical protein [Dyadobacter subterraneus]
MKTDITVITHTVKKGHNEAFEQWIHDIVNDAVNFEGYQGINIIKPFDESNEYTLTVRFDDKRNRLQWESSEIRRHWVSKLDTLVAKAGEIHYEQGVEFWFSTPLRPANLTAPKWKMALLTWSAVFTLICFLTLFINTIAPDIPLVIRLFSMTIVMTLSLTYIIMPRITKMFSFWLFKEAKNEQAAKVE